MVDAGTLVTDPQVIMLLGENAGANQIIAANVDFAVLMAEALIFLGTDTDYANATIYAALPANVKQALALATGAKAAEILILQNVNTWSNSTTTIKLNTLGSLYKESLDRIKAVDL